MDVYREKTLDIRYYNRTFNEFSYLEGIKIVCNGLLLFQ